MTVPESTRPQPNGEELPLKMFHALVALQTQLETNAELAKEFIQKMDDLIGHFEVVGRTMEILAEMKDKPKLDLKDLARAYIEADEEIFGEGDGEDEEDVDDPGDPRVRVGS